MVKKLMRIKIKIISEITNKYNNLLWAKKIQTEAKSLRVENNEFRIALKEFRTKLVETVVFNSNLTYVVRILEENLQHKLRKKKLSEDLTKRFRI
jgi:hypothetical protein